MRSRRFIYSHIPSIYQSILNSNTNLIRLMLREIAPGFPGVVVSHDYYTEYSDNSWKILLLCFILGEARLGLSRGAYRCSLTPVDTAILAVGVEGRDTSIVHALLSRVSPEDFANELVNEYSANAENDSEYSAEYALSPANVYYTLLHIADKRFLDAILNAFGLAIKNGNVAIAQMLACISNGKDWPELVKHISTVCHPKS